MAPPFDPLSFANALELLRTEIEMDPQEADARPSLALLRLEIGFVVARARAWARERGLRFEFIIPATGCDVAESIVVVQKLATALHELASRADSHVMRFEGLLQGLQYALAPSQIDELQLLAAHRGYDVAFPMLCSMLRLSTASPSLEALAPLTEIGTSLGADPHLWTELVRRRPN
jgi:hypothetical protein